MPLIAWIVIAVAALIVLWAVLTYNRFVRLRNEAGQGWSNIESQLKRRADLIPNLVAVVEGYASHESGTLRAVAAARTAAASAITPQQVADADGQMRAASRGLLAIGEAYPDLKASAQFSRLTEQLSFTEDLIAQARRMYNAVVRRYNTVLGQVPSNVVGRLGGFTALEFYRIEDDAQRAVPQAQLQGAPS